MSRNTPFGNASRRTRWRVFFLMMVLGLGGMVARAAVADLLPEDRLDTAPELEPDARRQADALSWFADGLFAEEREGPEKALESYRKALDLDPGNVNLAIRLSYDQLRRGNVAEAISLLKDAIKAAPDEPDPNLALSTIYQRHLNKPELAEKYARRALELDPDRFMAYATLFDVYLSQGKTTQANRLIAKAGKAENASPEFWISLAELAGHKLLQPGGGNLTESEQKQVELLLTKAEKSGTKDALVWARIGDLYVLGGQVEKALPQYQRAVELTPSLTGAREKLAGTLIETGRLSEAMAVIEEIIADNPLNVAAYDQLTDLQLMAENVPKALASAEQALILVPGDPIRYDRVIRMNLDQRRSASALSHAREALKRFPKTPAFSYFEALALSEEKRYDEAIAVFERTIVEAGNSAPDLLDGDFYFSYGAAAEQAEQTDKAVALFRKSITLDPANAARAYNYLGYMWVEKKENLDEAEKLITKALELDPGNGAYIDSLGWLYFQQGKYEEALAELLRAPEALPEPDAVVFEHIGDTYEQLGKKTEAVLYWQKASQLDPENEVLTGKLDKSAEKVAGKPES